MRQVHTAAARRTAALVLVERIERAIFVVRREKVMADSDLAALYGVATRTLIQAVKRNAARFPQDFMFQLTADELAALRSQIVISNKSLGRGGRRNLPRVFTEQGVAMLSSVPASAARLMVRAATAWPRRSSPVFVSERRWVAQRAGGEDERRDHAGVRAPAQDACNPCRSGAQAHGAGTEVRRKVPHRLRRASRSDGAAP